jgi:hypothetical protein
VAIRNALGAGWKRITCQFLAESALLAVGGGIAGILVGKWALGVLIRLAPPDIPRLAGVRIDLSVLAFTGALCFLSVIFAGLIPALHAARQAPAEFLREASRNASEGLRGGRMRNVYFPTTAHVSLLYTMVNGSTAEMGLVGNEGVVGIALFMGSDTTPNRAVIQGSGKAMRLNARAMLEEFGRGQAFQNLLLRYTMALITQISQTAVCNRLHSVEQRLCRWLLMTRDRTRTDELQMTQEFISNMLGVRREGVTHAAGSLQQLG